MEWALLLSRGGVLSLFRGFLDEVAPYFDTIDSTHWNTKNDCFAESDKKISEPVFSDACHICICI